MLKICLQVDSKLVTMFSLGHLGEADLPYIVAYCSRLVHGGSLKLASVINAMEEREGSEWVCDLSPILKGY